MPNKRLPRAAKTLVSQLEERYKTVKVEPVQDSADGLNILRQVKIGPKGPSEYLAKVLKTLDDPRIVDSKTTSTGTTITFSDDRLADDTTSFALDEAVQVAESDDV